MPAKHLLLLGGTAEAVRLSNHLVARFGTALQITYSLAGNTRHPKIPTGTGIRTGGFGGVAGLTGFIGSGGVGAILDVTHPFAAQMPVHAQQAARQSSIPLAKWDRPEWQPVAQDRWIIVPDAPAAADWIGTHAGRAYLTIGLNALAAFKPVADRIAAARVLTDPAEDFGFPVTVCRDPAAVPDDKTALIAADADILVTKASGGGLTSAQLAAARELHLPVLMSARPPWPQGVHRLRDTETAAGWVAAALNLSPG